MSEPVPTICPRAKSAMTPCFVRDGDLAVGIATAGWGAERRKVCVGCDYGIGLIKADIEYRGKRT